MQTLKWLVRVVVFLAIATLLEQVPWNDLFNRIRQESQRDDTRDSTRQSPIEAAQVASDAQTPNSSNEGRTYQAGHAYIPEDTPQLLYEYSIGGPLFTGVLSDFQKQLTMIVRVDGLRTINGRQYYKEVREYTGQEDFLEFLKSEQDHKDEDSKFTAGLLAILDQMFKTSITYARWDRTGELDVDGDDLTQPESRGAPLQANVGSEWSENGMHFKAVSVEDVEAGNQTYPNCLKIRGTGSIGGVNMHGVVMYSALGIGPVKVEMPNGINFVLRKYRR